MLENVGLAPERKSLLPPMTLTQAIEKASEEAPPDVETKIRAVGTLALSFFGDVPVSILSHDQCVDFLEFVWGMPKNWGQLHGKNRFESVGNGCDPQQIKHDADESDKAIVADVVADMTLTIPEKRFRLVQELRPRLTDGYLFVQRDMFNRIVRSALGGAVAGRDVDDENRVVPSHKQLRRKLNKWHKEAKTECGLPTRISRPKRRRSWALEHLVKLFLSPIYTGTSSPKQRWRKAKAQRRQIFRDALYWVPLFMVSLGVRPEEILQLKLKNVRFRDKVLCIFLGEDEDEHMKTEQSRRILPIPQLILDLGFREWVVGKIKSGETWAFPDVDPSEADGRRSHNFGKRMRTLLGHLELRFNDEDVYAMRRTLSSKLLALKVETGVRQRILGHLEGTTVDRHYSDDGLQDLKDLLDAVDYGLKVGRVRLFGFPIIVGCSTPVLPSIDVLISLTAHGEVSALRLNDPETDENIFGARVEGKPLPKELEAKQLPIMSAQEIATRVLALQMDYSFTLPTCEASTASFEHLLIHGDMPAHRPTENETADSEETDGKKTDAEAEGHSQPTWARIDLNETIGIDGKFRIGDTAICAFPLKRRSQELTSPRPGLVVSVRLLSGRRYLDIAHGAPAGDGRPAPHKFTLTQSEQLNAALLRRPTVFDLKRRILIAEDDARFLHRRLGSLAASARKRLGESMHFVGDVSPQPVAEQKAGRTTTQVVQRAGKVIRKPTPL
ncbi:Phage integrase family protein [Poseidonocella pacifica]|uniref:Phage integrase family protein n=1 Tax=Poseidonocella pacifica TaxID=871651 RepID=A0A1I0YIM0_9RHOB|nr:tyrosine-type recombinase/integrase [Poseidonocella pacifica]SFB13209.1 Phage integrase family protein [Poseidonocella pacifica]